MPYEVFEGDEGLARLQEGWVSLEERSDCHVFQTFAYAQRWQDTVGTPTGAEPLVVVLFEHDEVVAIFPACRHRMNGIPLLTWLGGPRALDYGDILFDADSAEKTVDEFVSEALALLRRRARGALLYLTNVRGDARAINALCARLRVMKETSAPYVVVEGAYDEYVASLSRNMRRSLVRPERRLSEAGQAEFRVMTPGESEIPAAIDFTVSAQRERFRGFGNRTHLFDERYVRYYMEQAMSDPHSLVTTLLLNGTTIAASLNAIYRNRMYCLLNSFDPDYAEYSPGRMLYARNVRLCFERGWNPCDFCWGNEAYKYEWTSHEVPLKTFVPRGASGLLVSTAARGSRQIARALGGPRRSA